MIIPSKESKEARKNEEFEYNNWVWGKTVDIGSLEKRLKGFRFHHKISTDGGDFILQTY